MPAKTHPPAKSGGQASSGLGDCVGKGEHRLRVKSVDGADQLPPEQVEAVERMPFLAAEVEAEADPKGAGDPRTFSENIEMRFPLPSTEPRPHRVRQCGIERVIAG